MIDYVYKAKDRSTGQIVSANVKADSPQAAAKLLSDQNLFAFEITPKGENKYLEKLGLAGRIKTKDKVIFSRQLSTLISAGLPLARALRTVEDQISSQKLKDVIGSVVASVEGGSSLSAAFAQHPKVFNEIFVALVAAGETSGTLDKALERIANQQEKDAAIMSKIRGAFVYPIIVLVLIIGVMILMLTTVVPEVAKLYKDLGKELPLITQLLVWLSNFLINFWWLILIALVPGVIALRNLLSHESMKYKIDKFKLNAPLFGVLFRKVYMARFARTMNTLLATGIPMLQAMDTVKRAVGNRLVAEDIDKAIIKVKGGKSLSEGLEGSEYFLKLVPQMSKIGEESGAIDDMLGRTATYYENEVDEAVKNLSTTLEPIMMVVLGGIVITVIAAVLGPVYSLVGSGDLTSTK